MAWYGMVYGLLRYSILSQYNIMCMCMQSSGELKGDNYYSFEFANFEKKHETYCGSNARLR